MSRLARIALGSLLTPALVALGLSASPADAGGSRARILQLAASQVGLVRGEVRGKDGYKVGWQRVAEYYKVALGLSTLSAKDLGAIKKVGGRLAAYPRWGVIFAVWAIRSAGITSARVGKGSAVLGLGAARGDLANARPGDILVLKLSGSRCLLEARRGNAFVALVGNAEHQTVTRWTIAASNVAAYFRVSAEGAPAVTPPSKPTSTPEKGGDVRARILSAARSQLGLVKDARGKDGRKLGWQRLAEYYRVAYRIAPLPNSWLAAIQKVGARVPNAGGWGGVYATWAIRTGGVNSITWSRRASGGWGPTGVGEARKDFENMRPGDLVVLRDKWVHHCILESKSGNALVTLDGNLGNQEVMRTRRTLGEVWYYYRTVRFDGKPWVAQAPTQNQNPSQHPATGSNTGATPVTSASTRICRSGPTLKGVDVSLWQSRIDWNAVKRSGVVFAIAKASEGRNTIDPQFGNNWSGMKSVGIVRGAYHFFHPTIDPIAQARHFVAVLNSRGGLQRSDLPPVVDVETLDKASGSLLAPSLRKFLAELQRLTGRRPFIYTAAFMSSAVGRGFTAYPLWVANYGTRCPLVPAGWGRYAMWQFSSGGSISGIRGRVDQDTFYGNRADLDAFIKAN